MRFPPRSDRLTSTLKLSSDGNRPDSLPWAPPLFERRAPSFILAPSSPSLPPLIWTPACRLGLTSDTASFGPGNFFLFSRVLLSVRVVRDSQPPLDETIDVVFIRIVLSFVEMFCQAVSVLRIRVKVLLFQYPLPSPPHRWLNSFV